MKKKELTDQAIKRRNGEIKPERENITWSKEDNKLLKKLFDRGVGITEIAIILDRSERAVCQKLDIMGSYDKEKNHRNSYRSCLEDKCLCNICNLKRSNKCSKCRHKPA